MNRYRIVYVKPGEDTHSVDFVDADSAAQAIDKLQASSTAAARLTIASISIDRRDPAPATPPATVALVLESLARALVRENTVLLALLGNPVFASSLTPARLASLQQVVTDAQTALDLAQTVGVNIITVPR